MSRKLILIAFLAFALVCSLSAAFQVKIIEASGTIYIRATGEVEGTDKIERDGNLYTFADNIYDEIVVEKGNITIDGNGYTLQGSEDGHGFYLSGINNVTIKNTNIRNFYYGVYLNSTSHSVLSGNNILNNDYGIYLPDSSNNTISENNIINNEDGVLLASSSNNSIYENDIADGEYGIELWYYSSNNKFYHNNFIDNTQQVYIQTSGYTNFWHDGYPSGGNYWSNYTSVDFYNGQYQNELGSDGIGDTEHVIDANNQDNYPLMGMFSDFYATSEWSVQTVCNSSISGFEFNGTAIIFKVSGESGTAGFCRLCTPKALVNETYRVFVNGTEVLPAPLPLPCSNITHNYIYFSYAHSIQEVIIIPEFPSLIILPLFVIATSLAIILYRRKQGT